jgi:Ca2+-transporting ATPase
MLTGDQTATARAVVAQIGLRHGKAIEVVDAATIDGMSPTELADAVRRADAFARVSPAQKLEIVRALQATGATVAMLGDGINDSPALRAADVGLAIGSEGAAAREVADVFIDTDDLGTLVAAVEQGRTTASNIRKSLRYLLATNTSEVMLMLGATAAGLGAILTPMQLLWINLISDVLPGIGLALEPNEPETLASGPQPAVEPLIRGSDVGGLFREAALVGSGAFAAGLYGATRYGAASVQTRTLIFGSLVGAQLLHAITCRSTRDGVFTRRRLPPNRPLSMILAGSFAAQSAVMLLPGVRRLLGIGPIGGLDAAVMLAGGTVPFLIAENAKRRPQAQPAPEHARLRVIKSEGALKEGAGAPDGLIRRTGRAAASRLR